VEQHVINGHRKKLVGLAAEVGDAVFDRAINDGIAVQSVGNGLVVALEEVLVDAVVFVEQLQSGLETLCEAVNGRSVEALVSTPRTSRMTPTSPLFVRKTFGPMKP